MKAGLSRPEGLPGLKAVGWPLTVATVLVGAVFAFPLLYLIWGTIDLGGDVWEALTSQATLIPLRNSVLIATAVALSCGILGFVLAWLVSRTNTMGRRVWAIVLPLPLVIPSFVGAVALVTAFGPGALVSFVPRMEGFWGAWIVLTLLSYPYVYLPVLARLGTTAPALEEVAQVLDGGFGKVMRRVLYPQVRGSLIAGMLLVFLYVLSDFGAVAMMGYDTITRAIFSARLFDRSTSLTLGLLLAVLALIVAGAEWFISRPVEATSRSGARQVQYDLGVGRIGAGLFIGLVALVGFFAPVAVFVVWVTKGSTSLGVGFSGLGDDLSFLWEPLLNSGLAAVTAAAVATVVVLPVAYAGARRRGWVSATANTSVASVFALPGLVVALAVVFWAVRAPNFLAGLYQTFPLLIAAYVLHFGAQSMGAARAAIQDLPDELPEAATTLGAGSGRRFFTVELPLIAPGLITGAGLVVLSTLKELPATLLLAPIGFQTLATRIWGAAEEGFFAEVGITSLVLIGLSGVLTWVLVLRRPAARQPRLSGGR